MKNITHHPRWFQQFFDVFHIDTDQFDEKLNPQNHTDKNLDTIAELVNKCNCLCNYALSSSLIGGLELLMENDSSYTSPEWLYILDRIDDDECFLSCKEFYKVYIAKKLLPIANGNIVDYVKCILYDGSPFSEHLLYNVVYKDYLTGNKKWLTSTDIDLISEKIESKALLGYFMPFIDSIQVNQARDSADRCDIFWYCMSKYLLKEMYSNRNLLKNPIFLNIFRYYCDVLYLLLSDIAIPSEFSSIQSSLNSYIRIGKKIQGILTSDHMRYLMASTPVYVEHFVNRYQIYRTVQNHKAILIHLNNLYVFIEQEIDLVKKYVKKMLATALAAIYTICADIDSAADWIIDWHENMDKVSFLFWIPLARVALNLRNLNKLKLLSTIMGMILHFDNKYNAYRELVNRAIEFIQRIHVRLIGVNGIFESHEQNLMYNDEYYFRMEVFDRLDIIMYSKSLIIDNEDPLDVRRKFFAIRSLIYCFGSIHNMCIKCNALFQYFGVENDFEKKYHQTRYDKLYIYTEEEISELTGILRDISSLTAIEEETRYGLIFEPVIQKIDTMMSELQTRRAYGMSSEVITGVIKKYYSENAEGIDGFYHDFTSKPRKYKGIDLQKIEADHTDILITTATATETYILHRYLRTRSGRGNIEKLSIGNNVYYIGRIGKYLIIHVQSRPGSFSANGSFSTIGDAITMLKPKIIFSLGVAFGIRPDRQKVGDVLIADSIFPYDENTYRNGNISISNLDHMKTDVYLYRRLLSIRSTLIGEQYDLLFGSLITGDSVVDDPEYKARIITPFQALGIIGGDMEAHGVYRQSQNHNIRCITIKGVCDYAEGKNALSDDAEKNDLIKDGIQLKAMDNVCRVIKKLFDDKHSFSDILM